MNTLTYDPLLFGRAGRNGLVGVEMVSGGDAACRMACFVADGERRDCREESFQPWLLASDTLADEVPDVADCARLSGSNPLNRLLRFETWNACAAAAKWLAKRSGKSVADPQAPHCFINDPVQQYLMASGATLFLGMAFESLQRIQVDIECTTQEGYDFCNAERAGDAIIAIALSAADGAVEVLSGVEYSEKEMLQRFVERVRALDPDVIEGHNIFNFDLPYLCARARRHGVKLALGRDGTVPTVRPSRISIAERTIGYSRFQIHGRHVVDTMFLAQLYDVTHRALDGYGLKRVARHFGVAAAEREYIAGSEIAAVYRRDPERVMRYVGDDVRETRAIGDILSRSFFAQVQMLPFSYQYVCVRGNATKIDALMLRAYLAAGAAVPLPDAERAFAGGYTDMFETGVIANVQHCDVRSLYPSLMLNFALGPSTDGVGVFLRMLELLRTFRVNAKAAMQRAADAAARQHWDALQSTFKVLINSFYGYLGFRQGHFSDFDAAARVASEGRDLLHRMLAELRKLGGRPIEIDTDGIYFVPPETGPGRRFADQAAFRTAFAATLPEGIDIEFDGDYAAMYSYKMKNYALLERGGEMIVKGAALKSRGLEPFQRKFMERMLRLKLEGRDEAIAELYRTFEQAIVEHKWPIREFGKTEVLQDSPATYKTKQAKQEGSSRRAAYELALRSGREYRAGDQVTYYLTGTRKTAAAIDCARLIADWNPESRDENVTYYLAKLRTLYERFGGAGSPRQGELF
jgi:DNA polymerase, archaea type